MGNKGKLYYDLGSTTTRNDPPENKPGDVNGNNNAIGKDASVSVNESGIILRLIEEIHHQQVAHEHEVDRLLTIIENLTNKLT